ncbi:hypothetical protein HJFPF1_09359 [Paramyrothecium foliicola]|nr:hypothetical protein HJFPF1_09359 [Paramyrothecium foliicola]
MTTPGPVPSPAGVGVDNGNTNAALALGVSRAGGMGRPAIVLRNLTMSRLCGLPVELVLAVMHQLNSTSLYCIRQTSALFANIFCGKDFEGYHGQIVHPSSTAWFRFAMDKLTYEEELGLCYTLAVDLYCHRCISQWKSGVKSRKMWEMRTKRWCHDCRTDHELLLFDPNYFGRCGRLESGEVRLSCIGRTGYVRLCDHPYSAWFTWGDVLVWWHVPVAFRLQQRQIAACR